MRRVEMRAASVSELWRYPVKSLAGERLDALRLDGRGAEFDRLWALVDRTGGIASGKTTRRFRKVPGLLHHTSRLDDGLPVVTLADGRTARAHTSEMSRLVEAIAGRGWSLEREDGTPHFDAGAVHLVTTATLETLSAATGSTFPVERLRPNVLLAMEGDGFPEDEWIGARLQIGDAELRVVSRVERCVMVNHGQRSLPARRDLLKLIGKLNGACAGVYADVVAAGTIRPGDEVVLLSRGAS